MFNCERCGSSYSGKRGITLENCPRCRLRDKVAVPLKYKLFESQPGIDAVAGRASPSRDQPAEENGATQEATPLS
jgi:predicted  nucleic acid-binding Zn-ribbon protein